jgi:FtsH-binding integral membrane protein
MGLMCLLVTSFINSIFLKSSGLQVGLSAITLIIFAGLTAYDVQKIKLFYSSADSAEISGKKAVLGALSLYMDFVNIFIAMLRLFGNRK